MHKARDLRGRGIRINGDDNSKWIKGVCGLGGNDHEGRMKPTKPAGPKRGVYCLANDRVLEWFQMFVRSMRKYNPDLPLTVIPYDSVIDELARLAPEFNFQILPEATAAEFDALEGIIKKVHKNQHIFRKWATFFGEYDEFIYVDADVAVATPLDRIFDAFGRSKYDLIYFDVDIAEAYLPQFIPEMRAKYNSPGFNAGVYMSRKGVINREQLWEKAAAGAGALHMFIPKAGDQPFLNWVMDTLPRRMTNIHTLCPRYSPTIWAQSPMIPWRGRHLILTWQLLLIGLAFHWVRNACTLQFPLIMEFPFVHWAGCAYPTMARPEVFLYFRLQGMSPTDQANYRKEFYELRRLKGISDPPQKT